MNCIEIINTDFELLGIITNFESLICVWNYYECGTFELTINKNKANTNKLKKDNMLIVNKRDDKILLIDKVVISTEKNSKTMKVTGTCIKGVTKRRIVATNGYDRVSEDYAENIQKHYLKNHLVESYYDNIRTTERDISWVKIAPTQNRGIKTVWQARLTNLHDELKHISEDTGLGWYGYLNRNEKCIYFDSLKGTDRTINQIENPNTHEYLKGFTHEQLQKYTHEQLQGTIKHPYIIFSEKKKNLLEGKTTDDNSNYKNVGYVAGKGENEDRLITVIGTAKGFDRREVLIDLNNIEDIDELNTEGQKKLDTYKIIQSIEGKVYQIPNMEWEKDFFLGDLVTLESDGIYEDKRIIQAKEIYEILYTDETGKFKELWNEKDINILFGQKVNPFITNVLLLLGYEYHKENIKKYKFDDEQIQIQKQRVRECLLNDIVNKHYDGIRISQMLWGTYFINGLLLENGRLQFEPTNNSKIKIHIPEGKKLIIDDVKESLKNSKILLKKYYNIENPKYICESWLLSKEISIMLDEKSNIKKFQELFEIQSSKNGINDVLNFVFNLKKCDNYHQLPETTRLQKSIKEFLINNGTIYEGYGELKE